MFSGSWLHKFALGGFVALALCTSLVSVLAQTPKQPSGAPEQQQPAAKQPAANETRPAPAAEETNALQVANTPEVAKDKQPDPAVYTSACGDTTSHDQADLCEQKRMSSAAERAADYAYWQLYISGIGLLIVAASLWFAGIGAFSARDAAKIAGDQAAAAAKSERPYVFLEITEPGLEFLLADGRTIPKDRLKFQFVNHGRTPALLEEFHELYPVVEGTIDAPPSIDPMKDRGRMLPVGTVSSSEKPYLLKTNLMTQSPLIGEMNEGASYMKRRLFFQGYVRYSDTFGNHYITGFMAIYSPHHGEWALRGDEKHNYSHQENPKDVPPHPQYAERPDPDSKA
jgi:hypothetical protein